MRKLCVLLLLLLAIPTISFAAFNDVTLTTDVVINVASLNLGVSGSSAVVESIVVGVSSFDVALQSGSSITVASSDRRTFSLSPTTGFTSSTGCDANQSTLTLSGTGSTTVTVAPTSLTCTIPSSGGGGGSIFLSGTFAKPTVPLSVAADSGLSVPKARNVAVNLFTRTLSLGSTGEDVKLLQKTLNSLGFIITSSGIGSPGNEAAYFGGLTVKAVGKFQEAHGIASPNAQGYGRVGPKTLAKLRELAKIPAQDSTPQTGAAPSISLSNRRLSLGMSGDDVKRLQQLLNESVDTQIASSGMGSAGNETAYFGSLTEKAVQKFQIKHGIVSSGTAQTTGFGAIGPKTWVKLQEISGQ